MVGSRTIKTLVLLLVCMTVGTLALKVLATDPVRAPALALVATDARGADSLTTLINTTDADVRLQRSKWRNVIVLNSVLGVRNMPSRCHFIIDAEGKMSSTTRWLKQIAGDHTFVGDLDYNGNSIGVCLLGDFNSTAPSKAQFDALVKLVTHLQYGMQIPAGNVFLRSNLPGGEGNPGRAFPVSAFENALIH